MLTQYQADGAKKPVRYWDLRPGATEQKLDPTHRKCISIVWVISLLKHGLEWQWFKILSDNDAVNRPSTLQRDCVTGQVQTPLIRAGCWCSTKCDGQKPSDGSIFATWKKRIWWDTTSALYTSVNGSLFEYTDSHNDEQEKSWVSSFVNLKAAQPLVSHRTV